ncbi:MAG: hypothetical protein FWD76_05865, partial [Firmicutes bacterium]|nr:hypothetical protein [Bacillota bacterium]
NNSDDSLSLADMLPSLGILGTPRNIAFARYGSDLTSSEFYFAATNLTNNHTDLIKVDNGTFTRINQESLTTALNYFTYSESNASLYFKSNKLYRQSLLTDDLIAYNTNDSADLSPIVAVADNVLYTTQNRQTGSVLRAITKDTLQENGNGTGVFLRSRFNADGFYADPSNIVSKNGALYIADTSNDRVAQINNRGFNTFASSTSKPRSVAIANNGTRYTLSMDGTIEGGANPITVPSKLQGIATDAVDNLYGFDNTTLYLLGGQPSSVFDASNNEKIVDVYTPGKKSGLYILTTNNASKTSSVYHFEKQAGSTSVTADLMNTFTTNGISQIALDYRENIFALDTDGVLSKYTNAGNWNYALDTNHQLDLQVADMPVDADLVIANSAISSSFGTNNAIQAEIAAGDILFLDHTRHALSQIKKDDIGVDNQPEYPDPDEGLWLVNKPYEPDNDTQIIWEAQKTTSLFAAPNINSTALKSVQENDTVLMLVLDLPTDLDGDGTNDFDGETFENYAFVALENNTPTNGNQTNVALLFGYIYLPDFSTQNYPYTQMVKETQTISNGTNLYMMPSLHSTTRNETVLPKNTPLTLLPFADYKRIGSKWSRVTWKDENGIDVFGFVLSKNIENGVDILPSVKVPNATIQLQNVDAIPMLGRISRATLSKAAPTLKSGDRITVESWFNPTNKFTNIEYRDANGTLWQTSIESKYIQSDSVSQLQFSALTITLILVPLFAVIAFLYYRNCKYRRTLIPEIYEQEEPDNDDFDNSIPRTIEPTEFA